MPIIRLHLSSALLCASLFLATTTFAQYTTSVATASSAPTTTFAQYTTSVATASSAPTTNVVTSFKLSDFSGANDAGFAWRNDPNASTPSERQLGEVFTASSTYNISAITLKTRASNNSAIMGAAFTVTFYKFASTASNDLAEGTELFTASGTFTSTSFSSGTFLTFNLDSANLELQSGSTYGFLLSFDDAAAGRSLGLNAITVPSGSSLSNRRIMKEDSSAISGYNLQSLEFYVQGSLSSVPEPQSFALVAGLLGLSAAGCVRRR
jgi:hypothetical protein